MRIQVTIVLFAGVMLLASCERNICVLPAGSSLETYGRGTDVRLQQLAFMFGNWTTTDSEGRSEEIWSGASGSCIMGSFRLVRPDGSVAFYEILSISAEADGVYMRLRHFDSKLVAREEKDAPVILKQESVNIQKTTTRGVDTVSGVTAVFRKISGSQSLATITYESVGTDVLRSEVAFTPESKRETICFEMKRQ